MSSNSHLLVGQFDNGHSDSFDTGLTTVSSSRKSNILPTIYLTNCNHILNKLDELYLLAIDNSNDLEILCLSETWLDDFTPDSVCALPGFKTYRKDRATGQGGGVLCYVHNDIVTLSAQINFGSSVDIIDGFSTSNFEVLWLLLRPKIMPRPFSQLIIVTVYCPPWYEVARKRALQKFITIGLDKLLCLHPNAAVVVLGDFNTLDTSFLSRHFGFRQLVKAGTRGDRILDKMYTNCHTLYDEAVICAPLGRSDHKSVVVRSPWSKRVPVGRKTVTKRDFSGDVYNCIESDLLKVNWSTMYRLDRCQDQANFFMKQCVLQ